MFRLFELRRKLMRVHSRAKHELKLYARDIGRRVDRRWYRGDNAADQLKISELAAVQTRCH